MRATLVGIGVLTVLTGATIGAQRSPSALDGATTVRLPSTLPKCGGVNRVLAALARTSQVTTGFQESKECQSQFQRIERVEINYDMSGETTLTVRQVLDRLIELSPDFRWSDMDGVAVVRPRSSWNDSTDALNTRLASFHFANTTVGETLAAILRLPARSSRLDRKTFDVAFEGGTMVEALNALVRARGDVGWNAGVLYHSTSSGDDPSPSLTVGIRSFHAGSRSVSEGALALATPLPRWLSGR